MFNIINLFTSFNIYNINLKPSHILFIHSDEICVGSYCEDALYEDQQYELSSILYNSPEIVEGKELTVKNVIWNVGLIFYYIFTRKQAFEPIDNNETVLMKILECKYNRINEDNENNKKLNKIFDKIFIKDINKRMAFTELKLEMDHYFDYNNLKDLQLYCIYLYIYNILLFS